MADSLENEGTLFEQRRAVKGWYGWDVVIYRVRTRRRDGVPIWFAAGQEEVTYSIRQLLQDRPDVQRGSIHLDPLFESDNVEPPPPRTRRSRRNPDEDHPLGVYRDLYPRPAS